MSSFFQGFGKPKLDFGMLTLAVGNKPADVRQTNH